VLATAAAVRGAGSWRALLEAGARPEAGGQVTAGGTAVRPSVASLASLTCGGAPPRDPAVTTPATTPAAATAQTTAVEGAAWPASAARHGFCGVTNDGVEGSCARGDAGSWHTPLHPNPDPNPNPNPFPYPTP